MRVAPSGVVGARGPTVLIVIPLHDSEAIVDAVHGAIRRAVADQPWDLEVCFVDDGSSDGTWGWIERAVAEGSDVSGVRLAENRGQTAAVAAGFANRVADVMVTVDGDLDFAVADVPRFVESIVNGHDFAVGVRQHGSGPFFRRQLPSWVLNRLLRLLGGYRIGDVGCGYFAFDGRLRDAMVAAGDRRRSIRPLLAELADRPATIAVDYQTGPDRDPVTSARVVTTSLDLLAAVPSVTRRLTVLGAVGLAVTSRPRSGGPAGLRVAVSAGAAMVGGSSLAAALVLVGWRRRWRRPGANLFEVAEQVGPSDGPRFSSAEGPS